LTIECGRPKRVAAEGRGEFIEFIGFIEFVESIEFLEFRDC
jgi:hypothetical protein